MAASEEQLAKLKHHYSLEYEMIRATCAFEHEIVKPLFLLNGGALVAFLALFGAVHAGEQTGLVICALTIWTFGLMLAVAASGFAARSQFRFRNLRGDEAILNEIDLGISTDSRARADVKCDAKQAALDGRSKRNWAVGCGLASIVVFVVALIPAFLAISSLKCAT